MERAPATIAIALLGAAGLHACGSAPPCGSSLSCGEGAVCAPSGACAPRAAPDADARSAWIAPRRWAATTGGALRPPGDRAPIGDVARLWLAFDVAPPGARSATLVLGPHDDAPRTVDHTVVVERVRDGRAIARVRLPAGAARAVRIDLSAELAHGAIEIAIRADPGDIALATPLHVDPLARPRLELSLARDQ